jgi:hypothetical protein
MAVSPELAKTTSLGEGMYYMFLHSLNIVDFGINPPLYLKYVHVLHHMVTNIFLVNYLIAVMSNLASESVEKTEIVQCIRKLDTYYLVEERYGTRLWRLLSRCRKTAKQDFTVVV